MEKRKVVFICAPYDAKDSITHAKEIALVSHFRALMVYACLQCISLAL